MTDLFLATATDGNFPTYFVAVYVVGFIAAVSIGSIAWYNSKRPAGWEDASRPDIVPEVKLGSKPGEKPE
jgi:hypothetical protein